MEKRLNGKRISKASLNGFVNYGIVIAAFALIQLLLAVQKPLGVTLVSNIMQSLLVPACCYIVMAVSLNLTVGILGELSLGHAGFMSLGAFSGVVASFLLAEAIPFAPLRLALSMAVGAVFGAAGGVIVGVPVLRLQGDYLAIVTLAFGQIIKNIIMVLYVGVDETGFHIAAHGVQQEQHAVHVPALLQLGQEGEDMLVLGGLGVAGGGGVALDLADDGQAVDGTVGGAGQGGAEVQDGLGVLRRVFLFGIGGLCGFSHNNPSLSPVFSAGFRKIHLRRQKPYNNVRLGGKM